MTEAQAWDIVAQTLDRLERKVDANLAALNSKVEAKADKADVVRLDKGREDERIANEKRFVALETAQASSSGVSAFVGRFWVGCSAAAGLGALVVLIAEKIH